MIYSKMLADGVNAQDVIQRADANHDFLSKGWKARLYRLTGVEDRAPILVPVPEHVVSNDFDTADLHGEEVGPYFYLDDDGKLYPVTVGDQSPCNSDDENPFHYAYAPLMANGKQVGMVQYTDH